MREEGKRSMDALDGFNGKRSPLGCQSSSNVAWKSREQDNVTSLSNQAEAYDPGVEKLGMRGTSG